MPKNNFDPKICPECGQTTLYQVALDKGSAQIVLDIFRAIASKGVNEIHPAREMGLDFKSGRKKWFLTNLSRPRVHGLIAYVKDKKGYYCLTKKAGKFLRNERILKTAIKSKATGHQVGYMEGEFTTLNALLKSEIMWEGEYAKMLNRIDPPDQAVNAQLF